MWSHRGQIGLEEVHILEPNSVHNSFWLVHGNMATFRVHSLYGAVLEKRTIPHKDLILKLNLKLFLNVVPSSFTDVTMRDAWMLSWSVCNVALTVHVN